MTYASTEVIFSCVFRAKYLDGLAELLAEGALDIPPELAALATPESRRAVLRQWRTEPWVVYSKPPFAGPRKLVDYLGRYTHRVAISNDRLVGCDEGQVRFSYRDRKEGDRLKTATLPAAEFIGRFLHHVLPARFMRIRHYGFLANRVKQSPLAALGQFESPGGMPFPARRDGHADAKPTACHPN